MILIPYAQTTQRHARQEAADSTVKVWRVAASHELHEHDRMTRDRALRLLADVPHGVAQTLMLAHGLIGELVAGLVLAGLATVVTKTVRIGGQTIKVEFVMITDAGRKAIEG